MVCSAGNKSSGFGGSGQQAAGLGTLVIPGKHKKQVVFLFQSGGAAFTVRNTQRGEKKEKRKTPHDPKPLK